MVNRGLRVMSQVLKDKLPPPETEPECTKFEMNRSWTKEKSPHKEMRVSFSTWIPFRISDSHCYSGATKASSD